MAEDKWVVAIPSYDRLDAVERKTLTLVLQAGIQPTRVFVFADPSQHSDYEKKLKSTGVSVLRGERGVRGQRNAIMRYFKPGSRVVEMDDDIDGLDVAINPIDHERGNSLARVPDSNLEIVINHLWKVADQEGCKLWGLYGTRNPFFMSHTYTVGLAKTTAQMQGYINPGESMKLTVPVMEDYERCLAFFKKGIRSLRANYLAVRTANRAKGGCASAFSRTALEKGPRGQKTLKHPRALQEQGSALKLKEVYPDLVSSYSAPNPVVKTVPIHGEVVYHPPGWRLQFLRCHADKRLALDVEGEYASLLGLGHGVQAQKVDAPGQPKEQLAAGEEDDEGGERQMLRVTSAPNGETSKNQVKEEEEAESEEIGFLILNDLKVTELRQKCQEMGVDSKGTKSALIDRILRRELEGARKKAEEAERRANQLSNELEQERGRQHKNMLEERERSEQLTEVLLLERQERAQLQAQLEMAQLEAARTAAIKYEEERRCQERQQQLSAYQVEQAKFHHAQNALDLVRQEAWREETRRRALRQAESLLVKSTGVQLPQGAPGGAAIGPSIPRPRSLRSLMPPWPPPAGTERSLHPSNSDCKTGESASDANMRLWALPACGPAWRPPAGVLKPPTAEDTADDQKGSRGLHPTAEESSNAASDKLSAPPSMSSPGREGAGGSSRVPMSGHSTSYTKHNDSAETELMASKTLLGIQVGQGRAMASRSRSRSPHEQNQRSCGQTGDANMLPPDASDSLGPRPAHAPQVSGSSCIPSSPPIPQLQTSGQACVNSSLLREPDCIFWAPIPGGPAKDLSLFLWDTRDNDPFFTCAYAALEMFCDPFNVVLPDTEGAGWQSSVAKGLRTRPGWDKFPRAACAAHGGSFAVGLAATPERRERAAWLALSVDLALRRNQARIIDLRLRRRGGEAPDFAGLCTAASRARSEALAGVPQWMPPS